MSDSTVDLSMDECPYWIEHPPVRKTLDNWEPVSRPSQVVQALIEKLRNQHNTCVSEICTNLTRINQEIESDIRIKAHDLKHDLNVYKTTGYNRINTLESSKTEITNFDETEFIKIRLFCMNLIQQAKFKINNYCAWLQDLEQYRAGKFKVILQTGYMKTQKCCYKLPYEMQQFFENQIIHINQMLLANLRNYKELQGHLCLTFNNDVKLMTYKITQHETEWRELCRNEIITRFKEHDIVEDEFEEMWRNSESMSILVTSADERLSKEIQNKQLASQLKEVRDEKWSKDMEAIIENIKTASTSMVKLYAETIQLFGANDFKLDDLKSDLLEIQIKESLELDELEATSAECYQILWQNKLQSIVTHLHTHYYTYISEVFDRWEKHTRRVEANKSTVLNNLEQITQKHDTALQNKHGKTLDKAIYTLCQQTDEKALQKSYKVVGTVLDKIKHAMQGNNEAELKIINKYTEYVRKENELLTRDIKELHGKSAGNDECMEGIDDELRHDNTLVLFDKLHLCEDGFSELKEHRHKLQESLYQYIESSSLDQQRNQATLWTAMETEKQLKNFENKLVGYEKRCERIRVELYDVRLTDIREHAAQFTNHQTSIEHRVQQLRKNIGTFEDQLRPGIDQMTRELEDLCAESKRAKYSAHASTYLIRAARLVEHKIRAVKEQVHSYHDRCNGEVDELLKDNDKYRLQIKTFTDGGSYSAKEASTFIKKLQQLDSYCKKKSTELKQEINEVEKYIIKEIHHTSPSYMKVLESILNTARCRENSALQLESVQNELKKEVYVLKYKRKRIDAIKQEIQSQAAGGNDLVRGEYVIKYSKELAGQCKEYGEYLRQTAVPSIIKPTGLEENVTQRPILKGNKSPKSKRKNKNIVVEFQDYTNQLFDTFTTSDSEQFIPRMCNILYSALTNMQNSARDFYSKDMLHGLENISVSSNYDAYMLEVLNKLKYYYIQCVQLWLDEVQYVLKITNEVPVFINQYCNNALLHVHDQQMNKLTTEYRGYLAYVRESNLSKINEVRVQLKPLHGYHGNRLLLDNLVTHMLEVQTVVKHEISLYLSRYEEDLERYRNEYQNIMLHVKDLTDSLKTVSEEYKYDTGLSEQAEKCIMVLKSLNISDSPRANVISTGNLTATNDLNLPENKQDINLEILCQSYEEEISDQREMIDTFREQLYKHLSMLEVIWNNDLDKILQLYTVTYE